MEEDVDQLSTLAGELGLIGVPVFLFQEGHDQRAERAFKEIARLSRGAHCRFDAGSARQLRELLTAVAVYAIGGRKALQDYRASTQSAAALRLLEQLGLMVYFLAGCAVLVGFILLARLLIATPIRASLPPPSARWLASPHLPRQASC